jgi:flagellar hook protein FlgE
VDIGSVVNQSLIGMQKSRAEMTQSAQQIAQATTSTSPAVTGSQSADLTTPLVNLQVQQQVFDSSARVLEVADQTIGALLDVKA